MSLRARQAAIVLVAVALAFCDGDSDDAPAGDAGHVDYVLAWDTDGVTPLEGGGFELVSALGYRVRVTHGYLTSYGVQMVECPEVSARAPKLFGTSRARAGHGSLDANPSQLEVPVVEDLTNPTDLAFGAVDLDPARWCQGHYLVARADDETRDLPPDVHMPDLSLYLAGTWQAPEGGDPVPFVLDSTFPQGVVADFADAASLDTGASSGRLVVRRRLATLFDTADFSTMLGPFLADAVLKGVIAGTTFELAPP